MFSDSELGNKEPRGDGATVGGRPDHIDPDASSDTDICNDVDSASALHGATSSVQVGRSGKCT